MLLIAQIDSTAQERKSPIPTSQRCSPSFETQTGCGCMDVIWKSLRDRGFSDEVAQFIAACWLSGTDKQYMSAWKKWSCWCNQRKVDILQAPVHQLNVLLTAKATTLLTHTGLLHQIGRASCRERV